MLHHEGSFCCQMQTDLNQTYRHLKKWNILNSTFYITWTKRVGEAQWQIFVLLTGSFLLNIFWEISLNDVLINEQEMFTKFEKIGEMVCVN